MAKNAQILVMHERKVRAEQIKKMKEEHGENYKPELDDEDDDDLSYLDKYKENKERVPLKWTPKLEATLEDCLIKHNFDFTKASVAFNKQINYE